MAAREKSNDLTSRLHMSIVQSSHIIKMAQLRLCLENQSTKRKEPKRKIGLETVTKLANITGRRWWLSLESISSARQKSTDKQEYYQLKENSVSVRSTYPEEISQQMVDQGNSMDDKRLHNLIASEKMREQAWRLIHIRSIQRGAGVKN